jgi:glycosyltransferase involved in cell wall biosynthesis
MFNNKPNVSVIIISYNRGPLIGRSIKSVLKQTYQNYEIIIVDDSSIDNTESIVKKYIEKDSRVTYTRHSQNMGISKARNTGIRLARGNFVAFQDSDDEWLPEKLEIQVEAFKQYSPKLGMVYSDMWKIVNGVKESFYSPIFMPLDSNIYEKALDFKVKNIGIGTTLIRKNVFQQVGLFDEKLNCLEDLEFFIRLTKNFYFFHINKPLINYYLSGKNISLNLHLITDSQKIILEKHFEDIRKDVHILSNRYLDIAKSYFLQGDDKKGLSYFKIALKKYPFNLFSKQSMIILLLHFFGEKIFIKIQINYLKI